MVTQKVMGYKSIATAELDMQGLSRSQRTGLSNLGNKFVGMGVFMRTVGDAAVPYIYIETDGTISILDALPSGISRVWLRLSIDAVGNTNQYSYSVDGENFKDIGNSFSQGSGDWKGERVGLYTYANREVEGTALFDSFTYTTDGPTVK